MKIKNCFECEHKAKIIDDIYVCYILHKDNLSEPYKRINDSEIRKDCPLKKSEMNKEKYTETEKEVRTFRYMEWNVTDARDTIKTSCYHSKPHRME